VSLERKESDDVLTLLRANGFLIALAIVVIAGLAGWEPLVVAAESAALRGGIVALVMFLMALPIGARDFGRTLRRPAAPLAGIGINTLFQPLAAWPIAQLLPADVGEGLIVAAIIPCTLASAAVWTRRGGGNDAVALVVTVITNAACFVVAPCWLWVQLGRGDDPARWLALVPQLALQVVAPMAVAQLLRRSARIATWGTDHKRQLSLAAQIGILAMVGLGSARVSGRVAEAGAAATLLALLPMIAAVVSLHLLAFWAGLVSARTLRLDRADTLAVAIAGSQKTLMVGLSLAVDLGCSILPLVSYHVAQLVIDTWLVDRWRMAGERREGTAETPAASRTEAPAEEASE